MDTMDSPLLAAISPRARDLRARLIKFVQARHAEA
jgi:hypothetical protein